MPLLFFFMRGKPSPRSCRGLYYLVAASSASPSSGGYPPQRPLFEKRKILLGNPARLCKNHAVSRGKMFRVLVTDMPHTSTESLKMCLHFPLRLKRLLPCVNMRIFLFTFVPKKLESSRKPTHQLPLLNDAR